MRDRRVLPTASTEPYPGGDPPSSTLTYADFCELSVRTGTQPSEHQQGWQLSGVRGSLGPMIVISLLKTFRYGGELRQCRSQIFDDLAGDDIGRQEAVGVLQARVL